MCVCVCVCVCVSRDVRSQQYMHHRQHSNEASMYLVKHLRFIIQYQKERRLQPRLSYESHCHTLVNSTPTHSWLINLHPISTAVARHKRKKIRTLTDGTMVLLGPPTWDVLKPARCDQQWISFLCWCKAVRIINLNVTFFVDQLTLTHILRYRRFCFIESHTVNFF